MVLTFISKPLLIFVKGIVVTSVVWMLTVAQGASLVPIQDPWFRIFVLWWFFSCVTSGMPEPTEKNSDTYLWCYRSMHLMVASGTSYFRNNAEINGRDKFD